MPRKGESADLRSALCSRKARWRFSRRKKTASMLGKRGTNSQKKGISNKERSTASLGGGGAIALAESGKKKRPQTETTTACLIVFSKTSASTNQGTERTNLEKKEKCAFWSHGVLFREVLRRQPRGWRSSPLKGNPDSIGGDHTEGRS